MLKKYMVLLAPGANEEGGSPEPSDAGHVQQDDKTPTSESSTETKDENKEPTLQDKIKEIVKNADAASASSTEKKDEGKVDEQPKADDKTPKSKEEDVEKKEPLTAKQKDEDSRLDKNPRFQEVLREKNEFKTKYEQAEPVVQRMRKIEEFCQKSNITAADYDSTIQLLATLKTNPTEGIKLLESKLTELKIAAGEALPADLAKEVAEGTLSEAQAKREAKTRVEASTIKQQQEQFHRQSQEQQFRQIDQAEQSWIQSKMATDVDYKPKSDPSLPDGKFEFVEKAFASYWNAPDKHPMYSAQDVIKYREKAYEDVQAFAKQFIPKPTVRRPVTSNGSRTKEQSEDDKIDITKPGWARDVGRRAAASRSE
jgi:hypothetical protein